VRTHSPGGGDAALALPPGHWNRSPQWRRHSSSGTDPTVAHIVPAHRRAVSARDSRTVPSIVRVDGGLTLLKIFGQDGHVNQPVLSRLPTAGMHLRKYPAAIMPRGRLVSRGTVFWCCQHSAALASARQFLCGICGLRDAGLRCGSCKREIYGHEILHEKSNRSVLLALSLSVANVVTTNVGF